jgi:hypothetical protein
MASSDMAKLRAGTNRHLVDRRRVPAVDSCVEVLDSTGRSTSCARCIAACLASAIAGLGCPGPGAALPPPDHPEAPSGGAPHSALAAEDVDPPSYGKAELRRALISERAAEATLERRVGEIEAKLADPPAPGAINPALEDQLRVVTADLAVRRRFIATLEVCEAAGRWCPPRLDDPPWAFDPDPDPGQPVDPTGGVAPRPAGEAGRVPTPHLASLDPPLTASLRYDLDSWRQIASELHGRACACRTIACVDSVGVAIDVLEPRPMPAVQGDDQAAAAITRSRECLFRLRGKTAIPAPVAPAAPDD